MRLKLPDVLIVPKRHPNVPLTANWLAGEGAGSWFDIHATLIDNEFEVTRISPKGIIECTGTFLSSEKLKVTLPYSFDFPSHCAKVTVLQNHHKIILHRKPQTDSQ